jgi:hypothetical protein
MNRANLEYKQGSCKKQMLNWIIRAGRCLG